MMKNMKKTRKYSLAVLTMLLSASFVCGIALSDLSGREGSSLEASAAEESYSVTPQVFGDGEPSNGGFTHAHVNDMVGMSISWGKKTVVTGNASRRTIADNTLSSTKVHSIWTSDGGNKNLAESAESGSYVKEGTFAKHESVKYYEIPGDTDPFGSTEAWRAAIEAAKKDTNTYDTTQANETYGEFTTWKYVLVKLAGDWTATKITGSYTWDSYAAEEASSFEVGSNEKVVTYTSNSNDNLYDSATMGGINVDPVPLAPFTHGRLGIPDYTYVILDLNGHTINRNLTASIDAKKAYQYPSVFAVGTGARLEVFDSTATDTEPGSGKITGGNGCLSTGSYANVNKGGAFHLAENAEVTFHSGTATGNSTSLGGSVYLLGNAVFNLFEGRLTGNNAHRGGGVYLALGSYSVFNMFGGEISSCATLVHETSRGGAVCVYQNAFCNIYGGKIHNNVAVWGGGISVDTNSYVKLYGGEISGNGAVKQNNYGASGAGVNLLADAYGVYINGPATVKGNYTLKDSVLNTFKGTQGVGNKTVTAKENRMTKDIKLELEDGGNKVLENYEVAGNLFLSKRNTNNGTATAPTNKDLGYAEIKVQGPLSKDGKNAEVFVSPDGGAEGNHFGKIMRGFITAGYDDTQDQKNTGENDVEKPDVWETNSGDEYQYTSYLCGNAVGKYFKSDSGADIIETLDSSNTRWVEITDLTKARTADVTWEYYDGTELGEDRKEENWRPFSEYPDNIPPSAIYDDETNWLGRVRFVFNKFRDTDDNVYCDLMERFVVEYDGGEELFKYTKTTYRLKSGVDATTNGNDKKAENYELDKGVTALVKSGAWIESSIVYCDGDEDNFTKSNVTEKGITEAGTYTFKIGAAAKPGSSSEDDTVFSPSDVLTDKLEQVQLKVAQRGLTVTGVEITKVYDGKIDVSDDLNKALNSTDAATKITPTITGGWLAQHYGKIKVASAIENPFSGVILDSPDVGTHISTKFESLSLTIEDVDGGGDKISRNYIVSGNLSNITVIITPAVLKKGMGGGATSDAPYWTLKNNGTVKWTANSTEDALLATYTGQPINPELEIHGLTAQTEKKADGSFTTRKDNVILEYEGKQVNANADKDGNLLDGKEAYTVTAKITTAEQGSNYVFDDKGSTTFQFDFYVKQKELTVSEWTASGNIWKDSTTTSGDYVYDGKAFTVDSVSGNLTPTFTGLVTGVDPAPSFTLALTAESGAVAHAGEKYTVKVEAITDAPNYYLGNGGAFAVTIAKREVKVLVHNLEDTYAGEKYLLNAGGLKQGVQLADVFGKLESNPNSTWQYADDTPYQFLGSDSSEISFYLAGTEKPEGKPGEVDKFAVPDTYYLWCTFAEGKGNETLAKDYSVTFVKEGGGDPQLTIKPATAEVIDAAWQLSSGYSQTGYKVDITPEINDNYSWMRFKGDVKYNKDNIDQFKVTYELTPTSQQQGIDYTVDGSGIYTVKTVGTYTFTVTVEAPYHNTFTHKLLVYISQEHVTVTLKDDTVKFTYGDAELLKSGSDISDWLLKLLFNTDHIESITGFTNHEMGQDEGQDGPSSIALEAVESLEDIIKALRGLVTLSFTRDNSALFSGAGYLKADSYTVQIAFEGDTSGDTKNRTITFVNAANKIVVAPKTLTASDITWVETGDDSGWSEEGGKLTHVYSGIASLALGNYPKVKEGVNALEGDTFAVNGISAFIEVKEGEAWTAHTGVCHVGTSYRIFISGSNPGGADGANYTFESGLAKEFSITPLAITLKVKDFSDVYGNEHPDLVTTSALELYGYFDYSGVAFAEGDNIGLLNLQLNYAGKISNATVVGSYAVKVKWDNADYAVKFTNESNTAATSEAENWWKLDNIFEITQREIEIVWEAEESYTFDGTNQSAEVKAYYVDAINGEPTHALTVTFSLKDAGTADFLNAGSYTATVAFDTAKDEGYTNYKLPSDPTREFNMAQKSVSVVWDGEYTYNGADQSNKLQAHYLTFDENRVDLDVTLNNGGEFKNAGNYDVTAKFKDTDGQSGNYLLTGTTHTYTMSRAQVTVSGIKAIDRIYDGTTSVSLSFIDVAFKVGEKEGLYEGDKLTLSAVGVMEDKHAGTEKKVTVSGLSLSGESQSNYELANDEYSDEVTVNITPLTISISGITAEDKTYDGTTAATFDTTNLEFGYLLSEEAAHFTGAEKYVTVVVTGEFSDANAGKGKVITGLEFSLKLTEAGESADSDFKVGNYTILTTVQGLTANITPAEVKVTGGVVAEEKVYDGTTDATLNGGSLVFQVTDKEGEGLYGKDSLTVTGTGAFDDKNVGQNKTVKITELTLGGPSASNYTLAESENQTTAQGTITHKLVAASKIVWEALTLTYSAENQSSAIKPYFEGEGNDGKIYLAISIEDGKEFVNAGDYKVRATLVGVEGGGNYKFEDAEEEYTHQYTISPYTVKIEWTTWSKQEAIFDGKKKSVKATYKTFEKETPVELTVKIKKEGGDDTTLLNAGVYTATVSVESTSGDISGNYTLDSDSLTHSYIIEKARFVIGTVEGMTYTYNGRAQGDPIQVKGVEGDENFPKELTISYIGNQGNYNAVNAGEYTIEYFVLGTENYNEERGTYTFTIEKATITVTATDGTYEYNGKAQGNAADISGTPDNHYSVVYTYVYTPNVGDHSEGNVTAPKFIEAGKYEVTVTVSGDNYVTNTQHYTITIKRATKANAVQSELEFTYTGAQQTVNLSDAVIGTATEVTYALKKGSAVPQGASFDEGKGIFTFTTVAEGNGVVFTISIAADNNHEEVTGDVTIVVNRAGTTIDTFKITKEYTYSGSVVELDLEKIEGLLNHSEDAKLSYTATLEGSEDIATIKNAGTYSVTITAAETDNYKGAEATVSITVNRATFDKVKDQTSTYDGKPHGEAIKLTFNGGTAVNEDEGITITYNSTSKEAPKYTVVGEYVVNFTAEGANFETYNGSYEIVIVRATLTVSAPTEITHTYTGAPIDASAHVEGIVDNSNPISYQVTYSPNVGNSETNTYESAHFTEAGIYEVTVTVVSDNYEGESCTYTVTINRANYKVESDVGDDGTLTFTYNGNLQGKNAVHVTTLTGDPKEVIYSTTDGNLIDASDYTVNWSVEADNNHNKESGSYTVKIEKAQLTITVSRTSNTEVIYGSAAPTDFKLSYAGWQGSDDEALLQGLTFKIETEEALTRLPAGDYTVGVNKDIEQLLTNYKVTVVTAQFTVKPKSIEVNVLSQSVTYREGGTIVDGKWTPKLDATQWQVVGDGLVGNDEIVVNLTLETAEKYNVGSYAITGTAGEGKATANYSINFLSGVLTVNAASIQIKAIKSENCTYGDVRPATFTIDGETYKENDYEFTDGVTIRVMYYLDNVEPDTNLPQNAGTYNVKLVLEGNESENYQLTGSTEATLTILKRTLILSAVQKAADEIKGSDTAVKGFKLPYTGESQSVSDEALKALIAAMRAAEDFLIESDRTKDPFTAESGDGTTVGSYQITLKLTEAIASNYQWDSTGSDTAYITFTIVQAKNYVELSTQEGKDQAEWVYDGLAAGSDQGHKGFYEFKATFGKSTAEYRFYLKKGTDFNKDTDTLLDAAPSDVGDYWFCVYIPGTENYAEAESNKLEIRITPRQLTVNFNTDYMGGTYGATILPANATVACADILPENANIRLELVKLTFTYSGSSFDGTYTGNSETPTVAGDYTVTASLDKDDLYNKNFVLAEEYTTDFKVEKAQLTLEWSETSFTYNGVAQHPAVTDANFIESDKGSVTWTYTDDVNAINAQEKAYTITVDVDAIDVLKNYNVGNPACSFTISKAQLTVKGYDVTTTKEYDGTRDANVTKGTLSCMTEIEGGIEDITFTAEATYDKNDITASIITLTFTLDKDWTTNFEIENSTVRMVGTISPKVLTVQWTNTELTYKGKEPQAPTPSLVGVLEGEDVTVSVVSGMQSEANAHPAAKSFDDTPNIFGSTYTAIARLGGTGAPNYTLEGVESRTQNFIIKQAELKINGWAVQDDTTLDVKWTNKVENKSASYIYNGLAPEVALNSAFVPFISAKIFISGNQNKEVFQKDVDYRYIFDSSNQDHATAAAGSTFTVSVQWLSITGNYYLEEGEYETFTVTIVAREVAIQVTEAGKALTAQYGSALTMLNNAEGTYWTYASGSAKFVSGEAALLNITSDALTVGDKFAVPGTYPVLFSLNESVAGNYDLTVSGNFENKDDVAGKNYADYNSKAGTYTITPATIATTEDFQWTASYVYNGDVQSVTINDDDFITVGGQTVSVNGHDALTVSGKDVGEYKEKVTVTAQYHTDLEMTFTLVITVEEIRITLKAGDPISYGDLLLADLGDYVFGGGDFKGIVTEVTGFNSAQITELTKLTAMLKEFVTASATKDGTAASPSSSGYITVGKYTIALVSTNTNYNVFVEFDDGVEGGIVLTVQAIVAPPTPPAQGEPEPKPSDVVIDWTSDNLEEKPKYEDIESETGENRQAEVLHVTYSGETFGESVFAPTVEGKLEGDDINVRSTIYAFSNWEKAPSYEDVVALLTALNEAEGLRARRNAPRALAEAWEPIGYPKDAGWYIIVLGDVENEEDFYGHDVGNYDTKNVFNRFMLIEIKKAEYDTKDLSIDSTNVTYNGTAQGVTVEGVPAGVNVIYHYVNTNISYDSDVAPTDAGEYTVTITFEGDTRNYNPITLSGSFDTSTSEGYTHTVLTFTIDPKQVTIVNVKADSKEYDGTDTAQVTVTFKEDDIVTYGEGRYDEYTLLVEAKFEDKNAGENKKVTYSKIEETGADTINYTFDQATLKKLLEELTATITPKLLTADGFTAQDKVYDGNTNATIVGGAFYGLCGGDSFAPTYEAHFENANAGEHTVTVTVILNADHTNYKLGDTNQFEYTTTLTATITRAQAAIDVSNVKTEFTYTGEVFTLTGAIETKGDKVSEPTYKLIDGKSEIRNAGEYRVQFTLAESTNYFEATSEIVVIVRKGQAALKPNIGETGLTLTYDGKKYEPDLSYTASFDAKANLSFLEDSVPVDALPDVLHAGSYQIFYRVEATDNYEGVTVVRTITVLKATYSMEGVNWSESELTYTGDILCVNLNGLPDGVTAVYTGNEMVNVGDYTAQVTFNYDTRNYNAPEFTTEFTWHIIPAALSVHNIATDLIYRGVAFANEEIFGFQTAARALAASDYSVVYKNEAGESVSSPIHAGRYTATITLSGMAAKNFNFAEGENVFNFTIGTASLHVYAFRTELTYTGTAHTAESFVLLEGTPLPAASEYSLAIEGEEGDRYIRNAGEYKISLALSDSVAGDYVVTYGEGTEEAILVTVRPAAVQVTWTRSLTYREEGYDVKGLVQLSSAALLDERDYDVTANGSTHIADAGSYTLSLALDSEVQNNFDFSSTSAMVVIRPAELYVQSSGDLTRTYDGRDHLHETTVTVTRRDNSSLVIDPALYTVTYYLLPEEGGMRETDEIVNAGNYTAVVTLRDTGNYVLTGATGVSIVIDRAVFTLVEEYEGIYDGTVIEPSTLIEKRADALEPVYSVNIKRDGKTVDKIRDAGVYTVYFTGGPNFLASVPFVHVTVGQRPLTVGEVSFRQTTRVYDGTTDVTALLASSTLLEEGVADEEVEVAVSATLASKNVGVQAVTLTFAIADPNYVLDEAHAEELFGSLLITVTAKPVQVLYNEDSVKQGGPFSASTKDLVLGDDVKLVYTTEDTGNTIVAEFSLEGTDAGNYALTETGVVIPLRLLANKWIVEYYRADWKQGRAPSEVVDAVAEYGGVASVRYYADEACTKEVSEEELKSAAAGTYYAKYTVERGEYYEGMSGISSFRILKADPDMGLPLILLIVCAVLLATLVTVVAVTKRRKHKKDIQ